MRHDNYAEYGPWESDQELKKPQPPLVKARMSDEVIALPKDFKDLSLENDLTKLLIERKKSSGLYGRKDFFALRCLIFCGQRKVLKVSEAITTPRLGLYPAAGPDTPLKLIY